MKRFILILVLVLTSVVPVFLLSIVAMEMAMEMALLIFSVTSMYSIKERGLRPPFLLSLFFPVSVVPDNPNLYASVHPHFEL